MLRVGILIDTFEQPAWIARMVERIQSSDAARVVAVIKNAAPRPARLSFVQRLLQARRYFLYSLYTKLDRRVFRARKDPFAPADLRPLLGAAQVLEVAPIQKKFSDYFSAEDIARIRALDLDVAIRIDFRILRGEALEIARHGVWSYHHGDNSVNRGGPAGWWELANDEPVIGATLQVLSETLDGGRVLARSWSATNPLSLNRTLENLYWKTSEMAPRELERLAHYPERIAAAPPLVQPYSHPLYTVPSNAESFGPLARLARRVLVDKLRNRVTREQWFIAYRIRKSPSDANLEFFRFTPMFPPRDRVWADPFPVVHEGKTYLFLEEQKFGERGHIAVSELADGRWSTPRTVLSRDYHLSYPGVFAWEGEWYMLPETRKNRTVELYRARRFPDEWEPAGVLLRNVNATDPTLCRHDGRWWLFTTIAPEGATCTDDLYLFHAESLTGPWTAHPQNPVRSDVRAGRCAGQLFEHHGHLHRPAQDSSIRYGYAIHLQRIVTMTPDAYEEVPVATILPRWRRGLLATHTLNRAGEVTVIDGLRRIRK